MIGWHDHQHWSKKGKDETISSFSIVAPSFRANDVFPVDK
jgi:hypothetical protein